MDDKEREEGCIFLKNKESFKQELLSEMVEEMRSQNKEQDKLTGEFQRDITERFVKMEKRIDSVEKEVQEGFHDLNNGWKRDLINQLVASLSGYKSNRQKIWLEVIKLIGIVCGAGGFAWMLFSNFGGGG